jgi:nucleoside-diphosphate-sugar epimerase
MPRVLIAGCGYVGAATADLLFTRGWEVAGWTRSQESARNLMAKPYPVRAIDIRNRAELAKYCDGFDAVIHCPSTRGGGAELYREVYLDGARNLLERFATSTIIFTSSTSVYAQSDGSGVNEESATEPSHETGRILLRTEKVVLTRGGIVARFAGIYGPGRSALLQKFLSGEAFIAPENDRFINQVHRDDLATALAGLLDRQSARGEIYNVVDNEPILQSACYRWLEHKLNRPWPPIDRSASVRGAAPSQASARRRGDSNKRVSNAKLRALGWQPQYPTFAEAMKKSILPSFAAVLSQESSA